VQNKIGSLLSLLLLVVICIYFLSLEGEENISFWYWNRPFSLGREMPLSPEKCGSCHTLQFVYWKESLHSRSMSPGFLGQVGVNSFQVLHNPEFAEGCYFCHGPAIEQAELIKATENRKPEGGEVLGTEYKENPFFDQEIKLSGVSCPVCHVREGKVYGPPPSGNLIVSMKSSDVKEEMHPSFVPSSFFEKGEFCAACHQLDTGYKLNGKVLVNTYKEWKESRYSEANTTCQSCHMPGRMHLFRGIHDRDIVRSGLSMDLSCQNGRVKLVITNTGVGHYFPTYVTPRVVVKFYRKDKKGRVIPHSSKEMYIGRYVSLDLQREIYDTRIPPDKSFVLVYPLGHSRKDDIGVVEIWVYPDEFYNRFYKNLLAHEDGYHNRQEIEKALQRTEESVYLLWRKEENLQNLCGKVSS